MNILLLALNVLGVVAAAAYISKNKAELVAPAYDDQPPAVINERPRAKPDVKLFIF